MVELQTRLQSKERDRRKPSPTDARPSGLPDGMESDDEKSATMPSLAKLRCHDMMESFQIYKAALPDFFLGTLGR